MMALMNDRAIQELGQSAYRNSRILANCPFAHRSKHRHSKHRHLHRNQRRQPPPKRRRGPFSARQHPPTQPTQSNAIQLAIDRGAIAQEESPSFHLSPEIRPHRVFRLHVIDPHSRSNIPHFTHLFQNASRRTDINPCCFDWGHLSVAIL